MFQIKKIPLPVPLRVFFMLLIEYGTILRRYSKLKLPLHNRPIPVFVGLHIFKYRQQRPHLQLGIQLHFILRLIDPIPINCNRPITLIVHRLVVIQRVQIVERIVWKHDFENVLEVLLLDFDLLLEFAGCGGRGVKRGVLVVLGVDEVF